MKFLTNPRIGRIIVAINLAFLAMSFVILHFTFQGAETFSGNEAIPRIRSNQTFVGRGDSDWPAWRGPKRDGKSPIRKIKTDWAGGLTKKWSVDYLCSGRNASTWSSPVIQGNRLVVVGRNEDSDLVFCLNADTGELVWKSSLRLTAKSNHGSGARATPCIDGDRVYTLSRGGALACWSLQDGAQVWLVDTYAKGGNSPLYGDSASPLVLGGQLIIQGGGSSIATSYDKLTGKLLWESKPGPVSYSSPNAMELGSETDVLVLSGTGLINLDASNGHEKWWLPWTTINDNNACTPIVHGDLIFVTSYETGCQVVRNEGNKFTVLWNSKVIDSFHSDAIIEGNYIYSYSGGSASNNGPFKCVDLYTGKEMWSTDELGWGTVILVDGYLLCMDIASNLFLVKATPKGFQLLSRLPKTIAKVTAPAWTTPVAANGKIYIRYLQELVCLDLTGTG